MSVNDKEKAFWVREPDEGFKAKPFVFNMSDEDSEQTDEFYRSIKVILDRMPDIRPYGERKDNETY